MLEKIDVQDTIVLDDDKKYLVVGKALYNEVNYLYLVSPSDYSIEFVALADNKVIILNKETDKPLINLLTPLFTKSTSDYYMDLLKKINNN